LQQLQPKKKPNVSPMSWRVLPLTQDNRDQSVTDHSKVSPASSKPRAKFPWFVYLMWFAFWTLLALVRALSTVLASRSEGADSSWLPPLAWNVPQFYLWMLLAPCIAWLGRRTAQTGWIRFLVIHIPASLIMATVQTSAMVLIYWLVRSSQTAKFGSLDHMFYKEFIFQFNFGLITYWLILAVVRGLEARRHLRDEKLRSAQLQSELAQAQLHALRSQLQPHFLFNTLNAISALALADPSQARTMISRLSDLLRLTLEERHVQFVSLQRELEFLECYLGIQRIRFQDRLTVQLHIGEDVQRAIVPHLILQPLVENALQHGLLPVRGGGTLRILIERAGKDLRLLVEDDGHGLPPGHLQEGIGIGNTRARLAALGSSSLMLQPRIGGGTQVEIRLLYRTSGALQP
jgi:two-component system, LytTR family, sensor kinase